MRRLEIQVLRALVFCTIFLLAYQLMFIFFIQDIAPRNFLNNFNFLDFTITFFGLHTFFALCAFICSRSSWDDKLTFITLGASLFVPTLYLIYNIRYVSDLTVSRLTILLFYAVLYDLVKRDFDRNIIRKYIKVIVNFFYVADEDF